MLNSLFKKNFIVIFLIFLFSFSVLYIFIYNYVPIYYVEMQKDIFVQKTNEAIKEIDEVDSIQEFYDSSFKININYYIIDEFGNIMYAYDSIQKMGYFMGGESAEEFLFESKHIRRDFHLEIGNRSYMVSFINPLDTVDGIREVLHIIIPYMIILGMTLALLTSYIFASIISKPIIKLNQHALEIANLEFKRHKPLGRNDEIGVLSYNLVVMSSHLEQALEELKSDITQVNKREKERKELMAILSHELKTPITILSGQTECMINGIGKYKDYKKYLKENLKEYDRLNNLVNQILVLSKVDNFDYELVPEKIKLDQLIKERIAEYQEIYQDKNLKVKLKIKKKTISSDKKLIEFIIKNLIENAYKYGKNDSEIFIETNENFIEIRNEIGAEIKKDEKELMSPFIQNDESRKTEGHGLGLYIVSKSLTQLSLSYNVNIIKNQFIFKVNINNSKKVPKR